MPTIATIIQLATALSPYIAPATVGVEHIVAAIQATRQVAGLPDLDPAAEADLRALVVEALAAKAEADLAASGNDPR